MEQREGKPLNRFYSYRRRVGPNRPTHSRQLQEETAAVLTWPVLFSSDSWRPTAVTRKEPPAVIIHRHH